MSLGEVFRLTCELGIFALSNASVELVLHMFLE